MSRNLPSFEEYCTRFKPQGLFDWACAFDTYRLVSWEFEHYPQNVAEPWALLLPQFTVLEPCIEEILAPSRGILLWHHQIEHLYMLCRDEETANTIGPVEFRKGILAKKAQFYEVVARNLQAAPGLSLAEVLQERMLFGYSAGTTVHATLNNARELLARADCARKTETRT